MLRGRNSFMESLLKTSTGQHWYPTPVSDYKDNLKLFWGTPNKNHVRSNFAYNMQYLEYLQKQISELRLSSVLITMLYKTYIIVAIGIIEMLFSGALNAKKLWKTSSYELLLTTKSNSQKYEDKKLRTEVNVYKQVEPYLIDMDFDSMIKKIEDRHLLSLEHSIYPKLKNLKKLRNRVHLQECNGECDHDYNNFNSEDYTYMKKILYKILTCPEFCNKEELYNFLAD